MLRPDASMPSDNVEATAAAHPHDIDIANTMDRAAEIEIETLTRRSLMTGLIATGAGLLGYSWLNQAFDKRFDANLQWPLRRMLQFNQQVAERLLGTGGLAPEFPVSQARNPRANGHVGLDLPVDSKTWRLKVTQPDLPAREFTLAEIQRLPKTEMVTELKCVEGWSEVVRWGGVRLSDFMSNYQLGRRDGKAWGSSTQTGDLFHFADLSTPDKEYFVGLDIPSALHPQTLLCHEMNGEPLTAEHGAPLRLVITVKYGIKNIKRIGQLSFTDEQPRDYWAERGYDWYAGL